MRAPSLTANLPENLFPLSVTVQARSESLDAAGQRFYRWVDLFSAKCLFTTAVRGAVRDQELRKDDRDHVRVQSSILLDVKRDVPIGARAEITWPADEGGKTEHWKITGVEHRPFVLNNMRFSVEQFDGGVR